MYTLLRVARVFYEIRQVKRNHPVSSGVSQPQPQPKVAVNTGSLYKKRRVVASDTSTTGSLMYFSPRMTKLFTLTNYPKEGGGGGRLDLPPIDFPNGCRSKTKLWHGGSFGLALYFP